MTDDGFGGEVFDAGLIGAADTPKVPPGKYAAELSDMRKDFATDGNPEWVWVFQLARDPDFSGVEIEVHTPITPAAMWRIHGLCEALGLVDLNGHAKFTRNEAVGKMAWVEVFEDEDGKNAIGDVSSMLQVEPEIKEEDDDNNNEMEGLEF